MEKHLTFGLFSLYRSFVSCGGQGKPYNALTQRSVFGREVVRGALELR
jgi:hypothetical protein